MDRGHRLNRGALRLVRQMVRRAAELGVAVSQMPCGATLVDCGIQAPGGYQAGILFAEACMAGLGQVALVPWHEAGLSLPAVQVYTDQPVAACMAAQYAGWAVKGDGFFAMGSGPARALARAEALFQRLPVAEVSDAAVLALETRRLPPDPVAVQVAARCGVAPDRLTLLVAPTASLVGSVQVAARVVETGLHKLYELDFDITRVRSGYGVCPVAPVAGDDLTAMGRTNDAILYGGRVWYTADAGDDELAVLVDRVPSCASASYGAPFLDLLQQVGGDFYKLDPLLFSPAEVTLVSTRTGRSFRAGAVAPHVLLRSFGLA